MVRKRKIFDIDFRPEEDPATETPPTDETPAEPRDRRGPMSAAIVETASATRDRASAEAAIRAENDALAHEHVRLKKLGLITDLVPTEAIAVTKLTRDRAAGRDHEIDELKESIRQIGLSNPIRVEQDGQGGFELIQGFRRLTAFRELREETGDPIWDRIPAALVPRGEPLDALYRRMVDENLVRKDISFGEMAQLALGYATDTGIKPAEAVTVLYASALKQKRSYIRAFVRVLDRAHGTIRHPEALPRALGLDLYKMIEAEPLIGDDMMRRLVAMPDRGPADEVDILRAFVKDQGKARPKPKARSSARTSLRLSRPEGDARVTASDGRVEMKLARDFSALDRGRLQSAVEAFFAALDEAED